MTSTDVPSVASNAPPVTLPKLLSGQKALVTGANSGIGKGVAIALAQSGADVVVNYVDGDDAANAVVDEIRKCGANAYAHRADVSSDADVAAMFKTMMDRFGTIDILVSTRGCNATRRFSR
jgi:glucose 1-dehydrogenase